jgi:hypothetical protein
MTMRSVEIHRCELKFLIKRNCWIHTVYTQGFAFLRGRGQFERQSVEKLDKTFAFTLIESVLILNSDSHSQTSGRGEIMHRNKDDFVCFIVNDIQVRFVTQRWKGK